METKRAHSLSLSVPIALAALSLLIVACSDAATTPSDGRSGGVPSGTKTSGSSSSNGDNASGNGSDDGARDAGSSTSVDPDAGSNATMPSNNGFPAHWIDGTACNTDPSVQVWKLDDRTFIFRQSLCTNFEGPFLYLLIGDQKALLIDTGTGDTDVATPITQALASVANVPLIVAHSHSHGDHVGGDSQFAGKPNTQVVGTSPQQVYQFFGLAPGEVATFDLGNRPLDLMPIPGHQAAHIALYDHRTEILLTGDTLYPGRLYIDDWNSYRTSVKTLADFATSHPITFVLGGHIELPKTGMDYAMGATKHPNEHALELDVSDVVDLNATVQSMGNNPVKTYRTNFVVWP